MFKTPNSKAFEQKFQEKKMFVDKSIKKILLNYVRKRENIIFVANPIEDALSSINQCFDYVNHSKEFQIFYKGYGDKITSVIKSLEFLIFNNNTTLHEIGVRRLLNAINEQCKSFGRFKVHLALELKEEKIDRLTELKKTISGFENINLILLSKKMNVLEGFKLLKYSSEMDIINTLLK